MQPTVGLSYYEVELVFCEKAPSTTTVVLSTPEEVETFLAKELKVNSVLTVVRMKNGADYGNYIAFVNSDNLAYVRVLEHRGFHATSAVEQNGLKLVAFQDESGCQFTVNENAVVSFSTALEALKYWLPSQERSPIIAWGEE